MRKFLKFKEICETFMVNVLFKVQYYSYCKIVRCEEGWNLRKTRWTKLYLISFVFFFFKYMYANNVYEYIVTLIKFYTLMLY